MVNVDGLAATAAVNFLPAVRLFVATGVAMANSPALPSGERLPATEPSRDDAISGGVKLRDLISGGVKQRDWMSGGVKLRGDLISGVETPPEEKQTEPARECSGGERTPAAFDDCAPAEATEPRGVLVRVVEAVGWSEQLSTSDCSVAAAALPLVDLKEAVAWDFFLLS